MSLIAFDLDGTLEDSRDDIVAAAHRVRSGLSLPPMADATIRPNVSRGMPTLYRRCFPEVSPALLPEVQRAYEADYLAHVADNTRLYGGVREALEALTGLASLAVVTNKPEHISRRLLETLGVAYHFKTVVGGDTAEFAKPDARLLALARERSGLPGEGGCTLMIGDSQGDALMGRAFGAVTVWCAWGYRADPPDDPAPDLQASTPAELVERVTAVLRRRGTSALGGPLL